MPDVPWLDVATVLGLLIALLQLFQVGRIATSTHDAVSRVVDRIGNYSVMMLVPRLAVIEKECEQAAMADDADGTIEALRKWHDAAGSLKGYLPDDAVLTEAFLSKVTASLGSATRAKSQIVDGSQAPLAATKSVRTRMTVICAEAAELAAKLQLHVQAPRRPRTLPELIAGTIAWARGKEASQSGQ